MQVEILDLSCKFEIGFPFIKMRVCPHFVWMRIVLQSVLFYVTSSAAGSCNR